MTTMKATLNALHQIGVYDSENYQIKLILGSEKEVMYYSVKISWFFYHSVFTWNQFWKSRSAKSAFLTHLEVLNFALYEILHFFKAEIYQIDII